MTLNKRERILAAATGVAILVFLGRSVLPGSLLPYASLRAQRDRLRADVVQKEEQLSAIQSRVAPLLADWEARSLPTNRQDARTRYQFWLTEQVDSVELARASVVSGEGSEQQGIFRNFTFTIRGRGSLEQLVELMHRIYSAGHLHQIRRMVLNPADDHRQLDMVLTIEALALFGADREDTLSDAPSPHDLAEVSEYRDAIAGRSFFTPYRPPPPTDPPAVADEGPPPRPEPPSLDHLQFTFLNGTTEVNGHLEAWLLTRTSGESHRLREGETCSVGDVSVTVVRIERRHVLMEIDGRHYLVALGENLRNGKALEETVTEESI